MTLSPALPSKTGWRRVALPLAVGLHVFAACEAAPVSDFTKGIQHDPPIRIGPEGTESIAFDRVIFDVPPGTVVGAHYDGLLRVKQDENVWNPFQSDGSDQMIFAASEELRRLGYSVTGNDEPASKPRFLLDARIQKMSYDTYSPSAGDCCTARVDVEWQLIDASTNQIVLSQPATGASRLAGYEASVVRKAFVSSLADLTSSEKFVSMVRKGAAAK
jgi:hypothetical protein